MRARFRELIGCPAGRTRGLAVGLLLLAWGCDASNGPAGPSPQDPVAPSPQNPSPEVPGILEVSISTSGTRPDADGYAVAVSVGAGDPSLQTVGPMGGTIRFPDLPSGTHSVRLESLAPNCSVQGGNPRRITIAAGATLQVGFAVFCPGPGAILLKTITTGSDLDSDGYIITYGSSSTSEEVTIGASDSLWISEEDLPPGVDWAALDGIAGNCSSPGRWRTLLIRGDTTTRLEFAIECMPWAVYNSGIVYERVSPHSSGTLSFHDTLSERYILLSNGKFRLQFVSGNYGTFEYLGRYHSSGSTISFAFDGSNRAGPWDAVGTLRGDSLLVQYNPVMSLADFEDAVFVRSP